MVERGGLENRYTFTGIGGSNPPLSATGNVPVRWLAKPSTALLLAPRVAARFIGQADPGRDGRVVDGTGLENRHTRKGIGGSNPPLSAIRAGR